MAKPRKPAKKTVKKAAKKPRAPKLAKKPARAKSADAIRPGHNSTIPKKDLEAGFARLDRLHDELATLRAEKMADIKAVYEELTESLNVKAKVLKRDYRTHVFMVKLAEWEADLDAEAQADHDRLMAAAAAFVGTPFGEYAASQANVVGERKPEEGDREFEDGTVE